MGDDHLVAYRREAFLLGAYPDEEANRRGAFHLGAYHLEAYLSEVADFLDLEEAPSSMEDPSSRDGLGFVG